MALTIGNSRQHGAHNLTGWERFKYVQCITSEVVNRFLYYTTSPLTIITGVDCIQGLGQVIDCIQGLGQVIHCIQDLGQVIDCLQVLGQVIDCL